MYEAKATVIEITEDSFNDGEVGPTQIQDPWFSVVRANSIQELLEKVAEKLYIGTKLETLKYSFETIEQNDYSTKVEVSWYEDADGDILNNEYDSDTFDAWKKGEINLYLSRMVLEISQLNKVQLSEFDFLK